MRIMQTLTNKENVKVAALNEVKKFIQSNKIDISTYMESDGTIDIKTLLQDFGIKL
jgi:hypothetical protein